MRTVLVCMLLVGCTDAADVATTVAHVHVTATCSTEDCGLYSDVFYDSCGPISSAAITPATAAVTVLTGYDAAEIDGLVQVQYTIDPMPPGADETARTDQLLIGNQVADVYSVYDYTLLYRITAAGEVIDIDTTKLSAAAGNTLQFRYTVADLAVQEDHVIDAPMALRLVTDSPGLTDACCSVGRPADAGLVVLVLAFGLGRRRRPRA